MTRPGLAIFHEPIRSVSNLLPKDGLLVYLPYPQSQRSPAYFPTPLVESKYFANVDDPHLINPVSDVGHAWTISQVTRGGVHRRDLDRVKLLVLTENKKAPRVRVSSNHRMTSMPIPGMSVEVSRQGRKLRQRTVLTPVLKPFHQRRPELRHDGR